MDADRLLPERVCEVMQCFQSDLLVTVRNRTVGNLLMAKAEASVLHFSNASLRLCMSVVLGRKHSRLSVNLKSETIDDIYGTYHVPLPEIL